MQLLPQSSTMQQLSQSTVIEETKEFVKSITKNRDESHGYSHALNVYRYSEILSYNVRSKKIKEAILLIALIHDVSDHKYTNSENVEKLNEHLKYISKKNSYMLSAAKIIETISMSYEQQYPNCIHTLSNTELLIRNIVSDADKLDSIGKHGLERCIIYTTNTVKLSEVKNTVIKYTVNRLLKTKNYVRTTIGRFLAGYLHDELYDALNEYIMLLA
jgi:uncharacterized protein